MVLDSGFVWELQNVELGRSTADDRVHSASFSIKLGEKVAFIGEHHSGRKVLLRALCGLRPIRAGELKVMGYHCHKQDFEKDWDRLLPREIRSKIGVSLDVDGLLSNVSVREGLEMIFRFRYGDHNSKLVSGARKIVEELCECFEINKVVDKRPVELSRAERRISALARAFISKPKVVVLEDPSDGISDLHFNKLTRALDFIFDSPERTVLLSTENFSIAQKYCSRWIVFDQGLVIFDGTYEDFLKFKHPLAEHAKTQRAA